MGRKHGDIKSLSHRNLTSFNSLFTTHYSLIMTHLEKEIHDLKNSLIDMWKLLDLQFDKIKCSIINFDRDLARDVIVNEKRVNSFELQIDKDCENIFALFNPVAIDLRFVLAVLKINTNLERIGDMANGVAKFLVEMEEPFEKELIEKARIPEMLDICTKMLADSLQSLENESAKLSRGIFKQEEHLNEINKKATDVIAQYITEHPDQIKQSLLVLSMIRKLERVGDQVSNIAEEIIFFIEAKVLKHDKKAKKEIRKELD